MSQENDRFLAWKESNIKVPRTDPVKLVDITGSFSWVYDEIEQGGNDGADTVEENCQQAFEVFVEALLEQVQPQEVDWAKIHESIDNYQDQS